MLDGALRQAGAVHDREAKMRVDIEIAAILGLKVNRHAQVVGYFQQRGKQLARETLPLEGRGDRQRIQVHVRVADERSAQRQAPALEADHAPQRLPAGPRRHCNGPRQGRRVQPAGMPARELPERQPFQRGRGRVGILERVAQPEGKQRLELAQARGRIGKEVAEQRVAEESARQQAGGRGDFTGEQVVPGGKGKGPLIRYWVIGMRSS